MTTVPPKIKEAIEQDSLVLFIGAGLSIPLGLPNWNNLILELIDEIAQKEARWFLNFRPLFENHALSAFEILDKMDVYKGAVLDYMERRFESELVLNDDILKLHQKLGQISKQIITTNYDKAIETANHLEVFSHDNVNKVRKLENLKEYVFKIHGDISDSSKCILFRQDYEKLYSDETAPIFQLKSTFTNKTILFIGFGMTDPYVKYVASYISNLFNGLNNKHYIINTESSDLIQEGIDNIKLANWEELEPFLNELVKIKAEKSEAMAVPSFIKKANGNTTLKNLGAPKSKDYFTGRLKELNEFEMAVKDGINFIAIDGPGGIGKTQFASKAIETCLSAKKVIWHTCSKASQLDTLISESGYPEILVGDNKSDLDKFSAFKDKIQENEIYLFLDDFQETNANSVFKDFLKFIQDYLRAGCLIILDRDDVRNSEITPKTIHIKGFQDEKLDYAKALINYAYRNEIDIDDEKLNHLCEQLQGYPLAIDFAIFLLSEGETSDNIIDKIASEREAFFISTRLLNAIFERTDATDKERDFMRTFSAFTGSVKEEAVQKVIKDSEYKRTIRLLQKKNLINQSDGYLSVHPLVREFCYNELVDKISVHTEISKYYISQRKELNPFLEELIFFHLEKAELWAIISSELLLTGKQLMLIGQINLVKNILLRLSQHGIENSFFQILKGDIAEIQGKWNEAQNCFKQAYEDAATPKIKAEGLVKYGEMIYRIGNVQLALSLHQEALQFCVEHGLEQEEARCLNDIGLEYSTLGDLSKAHENLEKALGIRKELDNQEDVSVSLSNLANIYHQQGNTHKALDLEKISLEIKESINNRQGIAISYNSIGGLYDTLGETSKARDYYEKSALIYKEIGSKQGIAASLISMGDFIDSRGNPLLALDYYSQCLALEQEIGSKHGISTTFQRLGNIHANFGNSKLALDYYDKSLKIEEEIGNKRGLSSIYLNIGTLYRRQGEISTAIKSFQKSLVICKDIGAKIGIAECYHAIGAAYKIKKDNVRAIDFLQKSLSVQQEVGYKRGIANVLGSIGNFYSNTRDSKRSVQYLEESLSIHSEIDYQHGMAVCLGDLGLEYQRQGEFERALVFHNRALKIKENIGDKREIGITSMNIGTIYANDAVKDYATCLDHFILSLALFYKIESKLEIVDLLGWINSVRKKIPFHEFKTLVQKSFNKLPQDFQEQISLNELIKQPITTGDKVQRNDPCPCGSGKKYKKCHGADE